MHHVVSLAPLGHIVTATIDKHIRLLQSADALCHAPVPLRGLQPAAHATGAKGIVTLWHSQRVHLLEMRTHVQVHPYLKAALLKVSAKVTLAVRLPYRMRHRCLVVYRTVWLHNRTATALQQLDGVFEQLLEAVVIHVEVIRRDAF